MKRVPVILQMTPHECGAACLAMVLSYFGRATTLTECRRYLRSGRDGLTARAIVQAARDLGLRVRALSLEPAGLAQVRGPAIVHWTFDHFLVLERWTPQAVEVVDPAVGRRRLSPAEFNAGFTGVILLLEPGAEFQPRQARGQPSWYGYLRQLLRAQGAAGMMAQILGASALLQLLGLIFPLFTLILVDMILPGQDVSALKVLAGGMVVLVVSQLLFSYLRSAVALYLETRLDVEVMLGFFEHMLALPFRFFQERTSGDLLMRLGSISIIREELTGQTVAAVLDAALVVVYLIILLVWQPLFGLVVLGFGAVQIALMLGSTRRLYELTERDIAAQAESQSYLVEALNGIATLKVSASEERALSHWSNLFFKQLNISLRRSHLGMVVETGRDALDALAPVLLLWLGALRVLEGDMSLGTMLAATTLAMSFLGPLASLVSTAQQVQLVGAHLERIADVFETQPEQDARGVYGTPQLTGHIEVRNAGFRYHPNAPWAIRHCSVVIEPGQKVAIVGRSGSGKSTLAMLLLGLYPLEEGEIRYDGLALSRLNYRAVRNQIGVVLQEPALFSGSLRRNIAAHDPSLPLEEIVEAADLAAIHEEIAALPMGYETVIAQGGIDLAGGQRQRLALARALAHRPAILILDEATSHLDAVTESIVDQNLSELDCTRIVIAHRLSTVRNADLILVLEEGVVVERGVHEELLALGGVYAALVHDQEMTPDSYTQDVSYQPVVR
ncbi:MAG: peptidase domain-containing ABC transporter [Caldilineaceae bacterium]|nr:peptidase domain-containing ABC transporter [Caldilineaceae bacterium]